MPFATSFGVRKAGFKAYQRSAMGILITLAGQTIACRQTINGDSPMWATNFGANAVQGDTRQIDISPAVLTGISGIVGSVSFWYNGLLQLSSSYTLDNFVLTPNFTLSVGDTISLLYQGLGVAADQLVRQDAVWSGPGSLVLSSVPSGDVSVIWNGMMQPTSNYSLSGKVIVPVPIFTPTDGDQFQFIYMAGAATEGLYRQDITITESGITSITLSFIPVEGQTLTISTEPSTHKYFVGYVKTDATAGVIHTYTLCVFRLALPDAATATGTGGTRPYVDLQVNPMA